MAGTKIIYVYKDWDTTSPEKIGNLYVEGGKGKEVVSFEYDDKWLENVNKSLVFDPDLMLYKGRQYAPLNKSLFGIFADSCPDRWGRLLMKRREAINAKKEERKPKRLTDMDFLLGVYDETRMGGLRFSTTENGPFLSDDKELATPPWTTLRKLESASLAFEKNEDGMEEKWLKQLLAPGSSLGGARPKASVSAPDGSLWIAKFPSKHDDIDVGACRTSAVYQAYRNWCNDNGYFAENSRNFNQALRTIGTVVRKRPRDGGEKTTLLTGYRLLCRDFLC